MSKGFTLWFTGLSGAGKSTLSQPVADRLKSLGHRVEILDGDVVRTNLSKGLGFSKEDRDTNVRRIGWVARGLARNGVIAITAAGRDIRRRMWTVYGPAIQRALGTHLTPKQAEALDALLGKLVDSPNSK